MKMHIIKALNMPLALKKMRESLGSQAVIYKTRHSEFGVEVLAGVGNENIEPSLIEASSGDVAEFMGKRGNPMVESKLSELNTYLQGLNEKIRMLSDSSDSEISMNPIYNAYYPAISQYGFSKDAFNHLFAPKLKSVKSVTNISDFVWHRLEKTLKINKYELIDQSGYCAIVGPTGVGKTTTLVKMAHRFVKRYGSESLGIITTDHGDRDIKNMLTFYADQLNIDLEYAHSLRDLNYSLESMSNKKLVLIDTYGVSQNDDHSIAELIRLLQACSQPVSIYLALPCSHQEEVLEDIVSHFKFHDVAGCILTKSDEAHSLTPILSTVIKHQLPIAYFCDGQRIQTDIHYPNKTMLISKVMMKKSPAYDNKQAIKEVKYYPEPMWVLGRGLIQS